MIALLLLSFVAAAGPDSGTQLTYRGSFVAEKGDPNTTQKHFTLTLLLARVEAAGARAYWTLEEDGRGGWPWTEHVGVLEFDAQWQASAESFPSLLYLRDDQDTSVVPLLPPFFGRSLKTGATWQDGKWDYRVTGSGRTADRDTWTVEVHTPYGRKRTVRVDQKSPLVVSHSERVFIGQGEQHELRFELKQSETLEPTAAQAAAAAFDRLLALREKLGVKPRTEQVTWNAGQLELLERELAPLTTKTPALLVPLLKSADRDQQRQQGRSGGVAVLTKQAVGLDAPKVSLSAVSGEPLTRERLAGKVTVLHFWEYRDKPLQEPYGQVGYLDFLSRRHESKDLQVFGVAVDEKLTLPDQRASVVAAARRLKSFMNLSYPLLLDDGEGIKMFGDPRVTGAKLPLFVVIGRDAKVRHYHVGHYEVHRDRGLELLDKVVTEALAAPRP